jgi:glycosyltransferase involved in cell wall biosynthesis
MAKKRIAIVGTHGVPAKYGGFETLADYLCQYLQDRIELTVYCNKNKYTEWPQSYYGAKLKYVSIDASGFKGIFYDIVTYVNALFTSDIILYLSPVGSGFIIPLKYFFGKKVIVNHGGLNEWDRPKLNWFQKKWAKFNHLIAAKFADLNIADNYSYKESLKLAFGVDSRVVRYGGDQAVTLPRHDPNFHEKYSHIPEKYAISVSRAQVDNNLHIALQVFSKFLDYPLVLVSNWNISDYGQQLKEKYATAENLILLDAIYDKFELDYLRSNAYCYIHTHSFCGTAPSLVEAMFLGLPIFSLDVDTNQETTQGNAIFFSSVEDLVHKLTSTSHQDLISNGKKMNGIASDYYTWELISNQYFNLFQELSGEKL